MDTLHARIGALETKYGSGVQIVPPTQVRVAHKDFAALSLRLGGVIAVLAGFYGAMLALGQQWALTSFLQLALLPIGVGLAAFTLHRRRQDYLRHTELASGSGPYVLYLRGFEGDLDWRSEVEAYACDALRRRAGVVAIDNVAVPGMTSGALRIAVRSAIWRDVVAYLGAGALGVIIDARGSSAGLLEELRYQLESDRLAGRPLLIVANPPSSAETRDVDTLIEARDGRSRKRTWPEVAYLFSRNPTMRFAWYPGSYEQTLKRAVRTFAGAITRS